MAAFLENPRHSFLQFSEAPEGYVYSCNFKPIEISLPVYDENDLSFQFYLVGTEAEIDELSDPSSNPVRIGLSDAPGGSDLIIFTHLPERFRLSATELLVNWPHGLPGFQDIIAIRQCFYVRVDIMGEQKWWAGPLQRIASTCLTAVITYTGEENIFGFNYCAALVSESVDPLFVPFEDVMHLEIPYGTDLQQLYGTLPRIRLFAYDDASELKELDIIPSRDAENVFFDFEAPQSGWVKITVT